MDICCSEPDCQSMPNYKCTCSVKKFFCDSHVLIHMKKFKCFAKNVEDEMTLIQFNNSKNALRRLTVDIISISKFMIQEIKKVTKESLGFIEEKKVGLQEFSSREKLKEINDWAKKINLNNRRTNAFSSIINHLLCIKSDSEEIKAELKADKMLEEFKMKYFRACETIIELKNQIGFVKNNDSQKKDQEYLRRVRSPRPRGGERRPCGRRFRGARNFRQLADDMVASENEYCGKLKDASTSTMQDALDDVREIFINLPFNLEDF
ncbi:hypothetical protein SteCoe_39173 [Stentor coeruleus]|uniref:Uncharacterized protein n=1 Tax=Stentor coeruleus TaxID=5963 RepID=A0A1R2AL14_9CILI|nr:hypothetical protein SteCoe_39173 [Stentor coeruleus]